MSPRGVALEEGLEEHREYWKKQLAGELENCGFPADYVRPVRFQRPLEQARFEVPIETCRRVRSICGNNEPLLFTLLVSVLKICLSRYNAAEEVRVGTVIRRRDSQMSKCNKILVLRDRVDGAISFQQFTFNVKQTIADAYRHQAYPFENLQALLDLPGNSRHTLFSVAAGLTTFNDPEHFQGIPADVVCLWSGAESGGIACDVSYRGELISREMIEAFGSHFVTLLEDAVNHPQKPLKSLAMLPAAEREETVVKFNQTVARFPDKPVHQLFAEQAARTPHAIAASCAGRVVNYGQLNAQANQIARYLIGQGIGPEKRVGILAQHSLELLAGILGILKSGAVYIPLDPDHPAERRRFVIEDSSASLVLTPEDLLRETAVGQAIAEQSQENPAVRSQLGNLAYVLYTSGSTGMPKGVAIEHRSLANYIWWAQQAYGKDVCQLDFPLYSSVSFDLTVTSIFTPLVTGNCIHIYAKEERAHGSLIAAVIEEDKSGTVKLTPSHLLTLGSVENRNLKQLILGGEALSTQAARRVTETASGPLTIWNEYGPTEATVGCMLYRYSAQDDSRPYVPIGQPAANARIYILDEEQEPVAIAQIGEIYIGGAGLARGYVNRPELTAERFVPDPFSDEGNRLYRTGDLARFLAGGNVEFLGRRDEQVKFHGHRVELSGIRAVLNAFPGILDSLVVVHRDGLDEVMVAYYVAAQELDAEEMRGFLEQTIIHETVPNLFIHLQEIPLTVNGKVNHQALPTPREIRKHAAQETRYVEPQTDIERGLVSIWRQLLGVEKIGSNTNFFQLGGHSLLATQLISRIRAVFGVELPVRALFESPTVSELAGRIEQPQSTASPVPTIGRISREEPLPLSYAQQRLWFIDQLEPGRPTYNMPFGLRLRGVLDRSAFRNAFQEIVRRHEVLRTSFGYLDGEAVQRIAPSLELRIEDLDLSGYREQALVEARRAAREEANEPFDLGQAPLLRVKLLQIGEQDYVLLVSMHHIVSDGLSVNVMVQEFSALYQSFLNQEPAALPELQVQYADYAVWQREWLQGGILDEQLQYWRKQLTDVPALEFPADHLRPAVMNHDGASVTFVVEAELLEKLRAVAQDNGATLFMALLAAFQVLLSKYTGQSDIAVGTPVANRSREEIENLIGLFVNTLVMRTDFSGNPSFAEALKRVREVVLEAHRHQDVPFEKLVEELQPERDRSRNPFFQALLAFQNVQQSETELPGLQLSEFPSGSGVAKFDISLGFAESADALFGELTYSTELFKEATMKRFLDHFKTALEWMLAHPEKPISEIESMSPVERQKVLMEWNTTETQSPEPYLHQLFEQQAMAQPDAPAVLFRNQKISYRELNRRANQLANYLRQHGAGPEVLVGVCMERSLEMVVSLMAILKSGGAYVPLDPGYPSERLQYMVNDCGAKVLLAQSRVQDRLGTWNGNLICVDQHVEDIAKYPDVNPEIRLEGSNLAYVIYTSGSTGRPKGAMNTHAAIRNRLCWMQERYGLINSDRVLQKTPFSFDVSVWEFFWPLTTGACLVVAEPGGHQDSPYLVKLIADRQVTTVHFVPSMLRIFLQEDELKTCRDLRRVICSGEALGPELQEEFFRSMTCELHNLYGPTEAAVDVTFWQCTPEQGRKSVPIGKPISNIQMYIIGPDMEVVPVGVAGELCIAGMGLARGYLGQPALTAGCFIANPFSSKPGERLYRTGDLARYLEDGNIEFLGRLDHQVKIRGFRIELGEIESVLLRHPAVKQAAVIVKETGGDKRLAAYVVLEAEQEKIRSEHLVNYLRTELPEYMVPAVVMGLQQLPLSPNGKLDRQALPEPELPATDLDLLPQDEVEVKLALIWEKLLKVSPIGRRQTFFELGGHSLLVINLMRRIKEQFGRDLPLSTLFEHATIEHLATVLRERYAPALESNLVALREEGSRLPLYFVHALGSSPMVYMPLVSSLGPDQPFYAFKAIDEEENKYEPYLTIEQRAARYLEALRKVQPQGPYILGGWSWGGYVAYEMARQLRSCNEEVAGLVLIDIPGATGAAWERNLPRADDAEFLLSFAHDNAQRFADDNRQMQQTLQALSLDEVKHKDPEERLAYLVQQMVRTGLIESEVEISRIHSYVQGLRKRQQSLLHHDLLPYSGPITLIRAKDNNEVIEGIDPDDPTAGWSSLTDQPVTVYFASGNHYNLAYPPHVQELAQIMQTSLRNMQATEPVAQ